MLAIGMTKDMPALRRLIMTKAATRAARAQELNAIAMYYKSAIEKMPKRL